MNRRTRGLAAGVAALGAGTILVGPITALAQSDEPDEPTTTTAPDSTSDSTESTPGTPDEPDAPGAPDASAWLQEALAPLVESGTLTQEQVDAVIDALREARPVFDGKGGPHGRRGPGHVFGGHSLSTAAEAIGISEDDLRTALEDGQTIAEVAEANGVAAQTVIDVLVAEATERLDEAVADGRVEEADAEEWRADITERITELVDEGELPSRLDLDELPRMDGPWRAHDDDRADDNDDTQDADEDTTFEDEAPATTAED